jgi:hypothetical protein
MKFTRQLRSTALGQALANHTHEYFSRLPRLSAFSKDSKQKIIYNFYQTIHSFQQAEDPLLAMRERLSAYVLGFSQFSVLSLTEADKEEQHASCPFISGQLHHHIQEIVDHVDHKDELHALQVLYKQNSDASELIEFCKTRRNLYLFFASWPSSFAPLASQLPKLPETVSPLTVTLKPSRPPLATRQSGTPLATGSAAA